MNSSTKKKNKNVEELKKKKSIWIIKHKINEASGTTAVLKGGNATTVMLLDCWSRMHSHFTFLSASGFCVNKKIKNNEKPKKWKTEKISPNTEHFASAYA